MAIVHAARFEAAPASFGPARLVALKIVHAPIDDVDASRPNDVSAKDWITREAAIATRLEHPNVVRTYDVGIVDGQMYLAMEYVAGASLATLVASSSGVPETIAARIAEDVLRGLHAAHELTDVQGTHLGLIHQDVSPQNVLVGHDGVSRLLDFGVARLVTIDSSRTDTVSGKPAYLAPEQLEHQRLDARVDVFALGIVLWEMLAGARLFRRESIALTYRAVLLEDAPRLPGALGEVVARALARDPAERFPSARAMRDAIGVALEAEGKPRASDEEVSRWVATFAERGATREDLEREILAESGEFTGLAGPDEPTLARPSEPATTEAVPGPPRRARVGVVLVLLAGVSAVGVAGYIGFHRADRAPGERAPTAMGEPAPRPSIEPASTASAAPPSASTDTPGTSTTATARPATSTRTARVPVPAVLPPKEEPKVLAPPTASAAVVAEAVPARLWVWSTVSGSVFVDGQRVGDSPFGGSAGFILANGVHTVAVQTSTGRQERQVTATPGAPFHLRFNF